MRMIASLPRWAGGPAALTIVALGLAPIFGVSAQSRGDLLDRIERLERRTVDLERQLYRGRRPPTSATSAAPRTPARATDLELRMMQLEQELRRLTGQSEESGHGARQLAKRLDQLVGDVDVRLKELERQVLELRQGTAPSADATASGATAGTRPPPPPARCVAGPATGASAVATSGTAPRPTPAT
ncbi:MAG: YbgF trimerization domain-containing protein, partial [Alphaproteobacteria bacterium]|nr:YbgF trimerization domain-containing protein [Alphaproteobacteria bacterium]